MREPLELPSLDEPDVARIDSGELHIATYASVYKCRDTNNVSTFFLLRGIPK